CPITRVGNQKKFLAQFCFEIVTHFLQGAGSAFPSAHPVAWITSLEVAPSHAQHIGVQGDDAHGEPNQYRHNRSQPERDTGFKFFPPEMNCQKTETDKGECIPIRCSSLV